MGLLDTIALVVSMAPGIAYIIAILLAQVHYTHVLQLEGYVNSSFFKWLKKNFAKSFGVPLFVFADALLSELGGRYWGFADTNTGFTLIFIFLIACMVLLFIYAAKIRYKQAKKPLVYTARIKRLFGCIIVVTVALFWVFDMIFGLILGAGMIVLFTPLLAPLSNLIMRPIEKGVQRYFFNDAKSKLAARGDMKKIGITGSYGKTSTKFILGTILSQKYHTLVPPQSYNTPMGLTRVIREQMQEGHEVFIAEMGARHVGDIAELCELVHPQYAILTSVGPQHLETFFTFENVINTKYELVESLPEDGIAVFNGDNEYLRQLYEKTKIKKVLYAMDADVEADLRIAEIRTTREGTEFDVALKNGERFTCTTMLLGKHNVLNILGGIAMAFALGLTTEEIQQGVKKVEPVEHRLQILPTGNGVTVIDDAFNSNPAGAAAAIEVIAQFEGRKIVVTPGMVELGEREDAENYTFGKKMSSVCDTVFLIGPKHTRPIYQGLIDGGFAEENIITLKTLEEASARMAGMLRAGDVVLFENDLPDNYNE